MTENVHPGKIIKPASLRSGEVDSFTGISGFFRRNTHQLPNKEDRVNWLMRLVNIALINKDTFAAQMYVSLLEGVIPKNPVVCLKKAQTLILEKKYDEATIILKSTKSTHPAIVGRLAYIAFKEGRYDEAKAHYLSIIDKNPFNMIAMFGLGRVYFEKGGDSWVEAYKYWVHAISLNIESRQEGGRKYALITAKSVASLFAGKGNDRLFKNLKLTIEAEDSFCVTLLVDTFSVLGVFPSSLPSFLHSIEIKNTFIRKSLARYFMAYIVNLVSHEDDASVVESEVRKYVEWADSKGVLQEFEKVRDKNYKKIIWRANLSLINDRVRQYDKNDSHERNVLCEIKNRLMSEIEKESNPLESIFPNIALWPQDAIGVCDNGKVRGSWVDLDALNYVVGRYAGSNAERHSADGYISIKCPKIISDDMPFSKYGFYIINNGHSDIIIRQDMLPANMEEEVAVAFLE